MSLNEHIEALGFLKPGWNGDEKYPAAAVNEKTREAAKRLSPYLEKVAGGRWTVGPMMDGAIVFKSERELIAVTIGAI